MKCERCLRACQNDAIYFDNSVRKVDYTKCKYCLGCVQVCPRNAIEVSSVMPKEVLTIKVDHDRCNLCLECIADDKSFCPNNLFYVSKKDKDGKSTKKINFKFREISKCQGCLKCELSCPEKAIQPISFET
ncbi:MAG: Electron transport complex subunit RsxB [Promethearchaeota archaeon]|nr:MAG: Electron transport complex subunit RsxB [Candidatus Lokiarchaeota archaeon]